MCSSGLKYVPIEGRTVDGWGEGHAFDSDDEYNGDNNDTPSSPSAGWAPLCEDNDDEDDDVDSETEDCTAARAAVGVDINTTTVADDGNANGPNGHPATGEGVAARVHDVHDAHQIGTAGKRVGGDDASETVDTRREDGSMAVSSGEGGSERGDDAEAVMGTRPDDGSRERSLSNESDGDEDPTRVLSDATVVLSPSSSVDKGDDIPAGTHPSHRITLYNPALGFI